MKTLVAHLVNLLVHHLEMPIEVIIVDLLPQDLLEVMIVTTGVTTTVVVEIEVLHADPLALQAGQDKLLKEAEAEDQMDHPVTAEMT